MSKESIKEIDSRLKMAEDAEREQQLFHNIFPRLSSIIFLL